MANNYLESQLQNQCLDNSEVTLQAVSFQSAPKEKQLRKW